MTLRQQPVQTFPNSRIFDSVSPRPNIMRGRSIGDCTRIALGLPVSCIGVAAEPRSLNLMHIVSRQYAVWQEGSLAKYQQGNRLSELGAHYLVDTRRLDNHPGQRSSVEWILC